VSPFFINTQDGRVAIRDQLEVAGLVDDFDHPVAPWHPIQGPSDASTMWYAVLRKKERGVFIGSLCFRQAGRLDLLLRSGWVEVPIGEIGV
jgi:hypothetical protein